MTTLTKTFVVLVCLFAFIFTPLAVSFAARTHNWKKAADYLAEQIQTAKANERSTLAAAATAIAHQKDLRAEEGRRAGELQKRIDDLEKEIADLKLVQAELESSRDNWENSAKTLTAELTVINTHNRALVDNNQKLTRSELDLRTRNAELKAWIAEQDAKVVIVTRQLAQAQEELAASRAENENLRQNLQIGRAGAVEQPSPTPTAEGLTPVAKSPIRGTVTNVRTTQGLASIDVGSSSGIERGMVLVVVRGEDYICDLVITDNVTPGEAIGRIQSQSGKRIRTGDLVIDEGSLIQ